MLVTFFTVVFVTVYDSYVMLFYTLLLLLDKVPKYMLFINWGFFFSTGLWKINEICAANWSLWQGKLCNEIDLFKSNTTTYTPPQL